MRRDPVGEGVIMKKRSGSHKAVVWTKKRREL